MMSLSCGGPQLGRFLHHRVALSRPRWGPRPAPKRAKHILRGADGGQPGPDSTSDGAASRPEGRQVMPPWEKQLVGDGHDDLRQQLQEHRPLGREQKLELARQELREEEVLWLQAFERHQQSGDLRAQDKAHSLWRSASEKLQLLQLDPDEFIRQKGWLYGLEEEAAVAPAVQPSRGATEQQSSEAAEQQPGEDPQVSARQAIQQFKPESSVAVLLQQERERLQKDEQSWLKSFEKASKEGDVKAQVLYQEFWRDARRRQELLERSPLLYRGRHPLAGDAWGPRLEVLLFVVDALRLTILLIVMYLVTWAMVAWFLE